MVELLYLQISHFGEYSQLKIVQISNLQTKRDVKCPAYEPR